MKVGVNMDILGKELIFGDFRTSDYGLILASFDYSGVSEDSLGMDVTTIEEFIGNNPVPVAQNITLTLPNVTNNSGYERLQKELKQA